MSDKVFLGKVTDRVWNLPVVLLTVMAAGRLFTIQLVAKQLFKKIQYIECFLFVDTSIIIENRTLRQRQFNSNVLKALDYYMKTSELKNMYYDHGHTVVGVEGAKLPVEEFFKTNSIEYTVESVDSVKGDLYQSLDKRIRLYLCDIFDFNSSVESSFDAVWDRGSFGAINKKERQRYAELLLSLISPNCRYLLDAFFYNEAQYVGPPRNVTEEDMQQYFGSNCKIELLDIIDMLTPERAANGLDIFEERLWLIVPK